VNVVLDTNVLVSGLLTPFGPSGEIVRMVSGGQLILHVDARILSEYREVLHRSKFAFTKEHIDTFLDVIEQQARFVSGSPLKHHLPDPDDEAFLEVAIAGKVSALVTGNAVHYPLEYREGVTVLSPARFLDFYRDSEQGECQPD